MSITVRIPAPLRNYTDGESRVSVSAGTVGEALERVVERYPELGEHLYEDGHLRNFVNAYLNEDDIRELDGEGTSVSDGDTLVIVPSIAGGSAEGPGGADARTGGG